MSNHYQTLGLPIFSDAKDVQKAFRVLAMKYHPDKNGGSALFENAFKELNNAYQVLNNPIAKQKYDAFLKYGTQQPIPAYNTPNQPPNNKNHQWTRKKEVKIVFTEFQKVYIKVSFVMILMFITILALSHFKPQTITSIQQLAKINQHLKTKTILYTKKENFVEASKNLDSIALFSGNYTSIKELEDALLKQTEKKAVQLFEVKRFKESLIAYRQLELFSKKYGYKISYENSTKIICLLLINNDSKQLKERVTYLKKQKIESFEVAFGLMSVLLKHKKNNLAEDLSYVIVPKFLEGMQSIYGPLYRDILATSQGHVLVIPALFQYLALSKNGTKRNELFMLEELLENMIRKETQRGILRKLTGVDFNKDKVKSILWTNEEMQTFKVLGLDLYYFYS